MVLANMVLAPLLAATTGCAVQTGGPLISQSLPALGMDATNTGDHAATPSLTAAFDRSHWRETTIQISSVSVAHQPTYVSTDPHPHPSPATATLALGGDEQADRSIGDDALELVIAPATAIVDLVVAPIRMCITPPWETVYGPAPDPCLLPDAPRHPEETP